jgi:hypothetical protein
VKHLNGVFSPELTRAILQSNFDAAAAAAGGAHSGDADGAGSCAGNSGSGSLAIALVGGLSEHKQVRLLSRQPPIVVATPGRLWELVSEKGHPHLAGLHQLRFLVVDEVKFFVLLFGFFFFVYFLCALFYLFLF